MLDTRIRNAARRLVGELVLVGVLAGTGATFPRDAGADEAWSFLFRQVGLLAHAGLGLVVVVEGALLMGLVLGSDRRLAAAQGVGLAGALVSVGAGVAYVGAGQPDAALSLMTGGWLVGLLAGAVVWRWASVRLATSRLEDA